MNVEKVLELCDVEIMGKTQTNYVIRCLTNIDREPSCFIDKKKGVWFCHSCGRGGGLQSFVMTRLGVTGPEAKKILAGKKGTMLMRVRSQLIDLKIKEEVAEKKEKTHYDIAFVLDTFPSVDEATPKEYVEYLKKRGVDRELARMFDVRYCDDEKSGYFGRVIFPITKADGTQIGFVARAILSIKELESLEREYKNPALTRKYLNAFGMEGGFFGWASYHYNSYHYNRMLHNLDGGRKGYIILVEGIFDCLKIVAAGENNVLALLKTHMTDRQIDELEEMGFTEFRLALDNDGPGREATKKLAKRLSTRGDVKIIRLPKQYKDWGEMESDEIVRLALKNVQPHKKYGALMKKIKDLF